MELTPELITTIVIVVGGVISLAVIAVRSKQDVTIETVTDALSDIELAAGAAKQWVLAAEQLWVTGKLEKDARFEYVLDKLQDIYPGIDEDTLTGSIEAAVRWAKMLSGIDSQTEIAGKIVGWDKFPTGGSSE